MRRKRPHTLLVLSYALLASVLSLGSRRPQPAVDPRLAAGFNAIRASHLRADLTFLASDALEGRRSLARGSEVAIEFIAAEFARAGLKPANGDSYIQKFLVIEYLPDRQETGLTIEQSGRKHRSQYPDNFLGFFPDDTVASGPVLFAGYGITAPEFHYDDYAGVDARGKIVLVFDHEPQETDPKSIFNGLGTTRYVNVRLKTLNAQQHGAVGVLVAPEPNRRHPSNLERLARIPGVLDRIISTPQQALADSEVRIPQFTVTDAVADDVLKATGKKPSELQAAIDATLNPASQLLSDTRVEMRVVNAERRHGVTANVVGAIEGSDPALRRETVIFTAHYDHDGAQEGKIYHGADDNGSGTVGVIELARAFALNPARPKRTLLFAVLGAEERGLLGSYFYVAYPLRPLDTTRAVINFDMIGRNETPSEQTKGLVRISADTSNELNLIGTMNSPDYRAVVEQENRLIGLDLNTKFDEDCALNTFQRSDQFPFALRDIPAVWWFTGFHPDYHQPSDTVEKINFVKMEKILRLAYLAGWRFAELPNPPRYVARPMDSSSP